ncbi:hypothetical protein GCM10007920_05760 [Ciceribacter naphthalenivorans]|uniref:Uncharacterized protein n=2 Tax=Alphaproteobacteria TaxID=28211 RepID=A0A512HMR9_9HYPH|nr:hypothetical protein RNA01_36730 [Ciceribacter naphthalenivorans]GLR20792.1 hypothetical protein GCM10007920_05760 [Ciceribacter naphthalenivorans]GLT03648.1 hypothetical protein GCM10007926_05760 [Sphingomonas psychrolutea]
MKAHGAVTDGRDFRAIGAQFTFLHELTFRCVKAIWVMGEVLAMPDGPDKLPDPADGLIFSGN